MTRPCEPAAEVLPAACGQRTRSPRRRFACCTSGRDRGALPSARRSAAWRGHRLAGLDEILALPPAAACAAAPRTFPSVDCEDVDDGIVAVADIWLRKSVRWRIVGPPPMSWVRDVVGNCRPHRCGVTSHGCLVPDLTAAMSRASCPDVVGVGIRMVALGAVLGVAALLAAAAAIWTKPVAAKEQHARRAQRKHHPADLCRAVP